MVYIFWALSLIILYYFLEERKKKRIKELIELIEKMKQHNYTMPITQDDFSILEDGIYKIFLELVEAREQISKKSEKQIEYLEDIAHQIKTPITGMIFSLENLDKEGMENASNLKEQLLRLNSLSDILLKLSSLDANKDLMKKEKINLLELVEYSLDILDGNMKVNIDLTSDLKDTNINGDFYWLAEALINILKNAYNIQTCDEIKITSKKNPIYVELSIQDNGGGIEKDKLKKIFKRFYKSPDSEGFGIGLSMAKSIIEKNNGEILVENIVGGARFILKFYNIT